MARLRHQRFADIHEVNLAIVPLLKQLNERPFQKLPGSRASAFAALDAPALQALPAQRYEIATFKTVKVHIDYHVEVEKHRYSVPHALVGQALERASREARWSCCIADSVSPAMPATAALAASVPLPNTCRRRIAPTWNGRRNA